VRNTEWVRRCCMLLPHATEQVQWGDKLVFKVAGKVFAVLALEPVKAWLSFKCTPEEFAELVEREGVIQAPHFARNHWVALENEDALPGRELEKRLRRSYDLVVEKLPKKDRDKLI
jgi:predicted DNA-binding protein (MmcQ/YjbR family)